MYDWLRVYDAAGVVPFIEAFRKMAGQYYPDKIDVCVTKLITKTKVLNTK